MPAGPPPPARYGLPRIATENDPVFGVIAYVPVNPTYPREDVVYQSTFTSSCNSNAPTSALNVTKVEPIELGLFPDYQVID